MVELTGKFATAKIFTDNAEQEAISQITLLLRDTHVELERLGKVIHEKIPAGFAVRKIAYEMVLGTRIHALRCAKQVAAYMTENAKEFFALIG